MMKNNKKKGFTIVELVIVIAVIAILAAVLIPTFSNVVTKANKSAALQEARNAMTNDLVEAEADYENMNDNADATKQYYVVSVKTGSSVKGYYTKSESTYTACEESAVATGSTTYYAAFAGTYNDTAKTYTYNENAKYTCVYNCVDGSWTVTEK